MKHLLTKDPYLDMNSQVQRLWNDYITHGKLIVGFDFDGTIYDFHNEGITYPKVTSLLQRCAALGFILVCYTANSDTALVMNTCETLGLPLYGINTSPVALDSVKPYFNILLDDHAGLESAYYTLLIIVERIENGKTVQ